MDRDMLSLRHQPSGSIADACRKIAAGVENLGVGGTQHRLAHLLDNRVQPVLHHRRGDPIDMSFHAAIVTELGWVAGATIVAFIDAPLRPTGAGASGPSQSDRVRAWRVISFRRQRCFDLDD